MDVDLYVYDLSRGMARQFSLPLTGIQIDAIYHTSLAFGGVEYFFGSGVQRAVPGSTHHGQPMQIIRQGTSEIPMPVIEEYMESLAEVYTAESYDLFLHNCNNFTQDLSVFLTGKEIPEHIRQLPQKVLDTPFGQMLRPQIDQAMRGVTQGGQTIAPGVASGSARSTSQRTASHSDGSIQTNGKEEKSQQSVHEVTQIEHLEELLKAAEKSCAVIFFTSATCAPCKLVYPTYDSLAAEASSRATLIKVDIGQAHQISSKFGIRATPTFITFLKGKKENEWSGADSSKLAGNVRLLIQMAWPAHPHRNLRLPAFEHKVDQYILYKTLPPLQKLVAKLEDIAKHPAVAGLISFVEARNTNGAAEAPLPDLLAFSQYVQSSFRALDKAEQFPLVDLVRAAFVDPRLSGYFAQEPDHNTLATLLSGISDISNTPFNLQVVTLQLLCNTFSSPLYPRRIVNNTPILNTLLEPVRSCLTGDVSKTRAISVALVYNLASYNHNCRLAELSDDPLTENAQMELVAAVLEAVQKEKESDSLHGELSALGLLVYLAPVDGDVLQLCQAMDAENSIRAKKQLAAEKDKCAQLCAEVALMLSSVT
ncbi:MAG: hypothetical protein Q9160_003465 [Pyrenula sp. 1 TL-2023]